MSQFKLPAPTPEMARRMRVLAIQKRKAARVARGGTYKPMLVGSRVKMVFHPD